MEERLLDKIEAVNQVKSSTNFFLKWPSLILEKTCMFGGPPKIHAEQKTQFLIDL